MNLLVILLSIIVVAMGSYIAHDIYLVSQEVPVTEIPVTPTMPAKKKATANIINKIDKLVEAPVIAEKVPEITPKSAPEPIPKIIAKECVFETNQSPTRKNLIINEVAWMGSANSSNDEWIELKNNSYLEIDISNYQLIDKEEKIKVNLSGKLSGGGFYLLERTDDNSIPKVDADQIYSGALENAGEGLRLFDGNCNLIDEVFASPDWPAGDNNYKWTMARAADFSWHNGDYGTPKSENTLVAKAIVSASSAPAPQSQPAASEASPNPSLKILINEIFFDAEGSDSGKEFIELYNPNNETVDISSWSIQHVSSSGSLTKKNFESGDVIKPNGFFLIWLGSGSAGSPQADMVWASGSLNNTAAAISINNGELVNSVSYSADGISGFVPGKSIERQSDFKSAVVPNPQNSQS
ncbi:MAG: lamin tail domain-containing protein [Patescibacteria group bacterium]